MNVFDLRDRLVGDYASYTRSFIKIADPRISDTVESALNAGAFYYSFSSPIQTLPVSSSRLKMTPSGKIAGPKNASPDEVTLRRAP